MKDEFRTELELMTDYTVDDTKKSLSVLIKHDFYSSDNDNGRSILEKILDGLLLTSDSISRLIITDSAVKLIESSEVLNSLISTVRISLICKDSMEFYGIESPVLTNEKVRIVPMEEITDIIIQDPPELIIE
ncbi:MAG: hypothetical protein K6F79_00915 [Saccharofermentans sp.]|nr:hypothetical protein [Saccharofermentans sp.]